MFASRCWVDQKLLSRGKQKKKKKDIRKSILFKAQHSIQKFEELNTNVLLKPVDQLLLLQDGPRAHDSESKIVLDLL